MSIKVTGLDNLQKQLKKMEKAAKELDGKHAVSFGVLFNLNFMREYTKHDSLDAFLQDGGFVVESNEDFEAIPEEELDTYVKQSTRFASWEEMLSQAAEDYTFNKLGF